MTDTPTAARTLPRVFTITGPTGTHALSSTLIHICNGLVHDGANPAFILDHAEMSNAIQRLGLLVSDRVTFLAGYATEDMLAETELTFDALLIGNAERLTADQFDALLSWATERGASRVFAVNPPAVRTGEPTYGDTIHDLLGLLDPADPERYAAVMREIGAVALKAAGEPEVQTVSLKLDFDPRSMLHAVAKSLFGDDVPAPGEDVTIEEMSEAIAFHLRLKAMQIPADLAAGLVTEPLTGLDGKPVEVKPLSFWTALRPARIEGAHLDATVAGLEQGWTTGGTAALAGGPDAEVTIRRTGASYTADTGPASDDTCVGLTATTLDRAFDFAREYLTVGTVSGDAPIPVYGVGSPDPVGYVARYDDVVLHREPNGVVTAV
ncbi:hypothetical protein JJL56_31845 [Azospirillum sp. YIM DDC1]|uniref:Uncharacterized protein n=1 Tax=Azospirillum aestuarii TaxID=2802052 RepID=A0ABS1I902_9PROT|nr:hypothetical protein [Azospirillum aestuarii]MBK4723446.1 hypothetical protein [Azospirillum aestuarii]